MRPRLFRSLSLSLSLSCSAGGFSTTDDATATTARFKCICANTRTQKEPNANSAPLSLSLWLSFHTSILHDDIATIKEEEAREYREYPRAIEAPAYPEAKARTDWVFCAGGVDVHRPVESHEFLTDKGAILLVAATSAPVRASLSLFVQSELAREDVPLSLNGR